MASSSTTDYRITKTEKGPLQRFKNQNLLLKKFGELGLQVYKAITGKRTSEELRQDLDIESQMFSNIITYMREAGMVELGPVEAEGEAAAKKEAEPMPVPEEAPEEAEKEEPAEEEAAPEEELTFEDIKPLGEPEKEKEEETPAEILPEETETKETAEEEEIRFDEIKPIGEPEEEEAAPEEKETKPIRPVEEEPEEAPIETEKEEEAAPEEEPEPGEPELSPVERIIYEKYGDVGRKVYTLIDGQRTAEQIMKETGLTEAKLVEILDFMDEQGIIKLEYPREKKTTATTEKTMPSTIEREEFAPMLEQEEAEDTLQTRLEVPVKAPLDLVKGVQLKAKVMLKLGDKGGKLWEQVDGKKDAIDLAMGLNLPLYEIERMLRFLLEQGAIMVKPMMRASVKDKYGDDGYAVYKRYGREGLMLYELIGKEMSIQEMANRVSEDKTKVVDMFVFIHQVLGIDLPIDKEVLKKQMGVA